MLCPNPCSVARASAASARCRAAAGSRRYQWCSAVWYRAAASRSGTLLLLRQGQRLVGLRQGLVGIAQHPQDTPEKGESIHHDPDASGARAVLWARGEGEGLLHVVTGWSEGSPEE